MKKLIASILICCLFSGCMSTYNVNKTLSYVFPYENVYGRYTSTYINTTTTVKDSKGNTTTYTTKGYIR